MEVKLQGGTRAPGVIGPTWRIDFLTYCVVGPAPLPHSGVAARYVVGPVGSHGGYTGHFLSFLRFEIVRNHLLMKLTSLFNSNFSMSLTFLTFA